MSAAKFLTDGRGEYRCVSCDLGFTLKLVNISYGVDEARHHLLNHVKISHPGENEIILEDVWEFDTKSPPKIKFSQSFKKDEGFSAEKVGEEMRDAINRYFDEVKKNKPPVIIQDVPGMIKFPDHDPTIQLTWKNFLILLIFVNLCIFGWELGQALVG